ncbi:uncharacterized protein LOC120268338 [Dioscorea cayenensis subsp. rotundata]|uniref:Uncharacterized protein LOC120268338 n=1 Tax=Dioscorea cayennensis subsp. rotundata TaxID=55577 RepID=A0AB40BX70_DIOCR|nr:uncharacterized protein LOC120268338 [Dioscorea cayenensis subsp. rotundata]
MEEKKGTVGSPKASITDELFGKKDAAEILGAVLSPPVPAPVASDGGKVGKDSLGFEIASSKKQATEDQAWKAQSLTAEAKPQGGSSSKSQNVPYQDKYCIEATMDTSSLGSSLYYGGPDVCAGFSSQYPPKKEDDDDQENANMASRGNWWQGSLYY